MLKSPASSKPARRMDDPDELSELMAILGRRPDASQEDVSTDASPPDGVDEADLEALLEGLGSPAREREEHEIRDLLEGLPELGDEPGARLMAGGEQAFQALLEGLKKPDARGLPPSRGEVLIDSALLEDTGEIFEEAVAGLSDAAELPVEMEDAAGPADSLEDSSLHPDPGTSASASADPPHTAEPGAPLLARASLRLTKFQRGQAAAEPPETARDASARDHDPDSPADAAERRRLEEATIEEWALAHDAIAAAVASVSELARVRRGTAAPDSDDGHRLSPPSASHHRLEGQELDDEDADAPDTDSLESPVPGLAPDTSGEELVEALEAGGDADELEAPSERGPTALHALSVPDDVLEPAEPSIPLPPLFESEPLESPDAGPTGEVAHAALEPRVLSRLSLAELLQGEGPSPPAREEESSAPGAVPPISERETAATEEVLSVLPPFRDPLAARRAAGHEKLQQFVQDEIRTRLNFRLLRIFVVGGVDRASLEDLQEELVVGLEALRAALDQLESVGLIVREGAVIQVNSRARKLGLLASAMSSWQTPRRRGEVLAWLQEGE